ncbi:MAG TPA: protein kinase [Nannocystaceae bacterium]|nr:protein kinase [Nannocystaceae bacterium]
MNQDPRAAFAGQIADVPVVELLQTILQGKHTGVARFETPVGAATLWFREGALIDADMGRHHMEAAVQRLLALDTGTFEVEFKPISRRGVIKASTAELIAQAPGRAGVPTAVPNDDTDVSKKRPRRQGVSWHPTGGGRGKQDGSSATIPVVPDPDVVATTSAAVSVTPTIAATPPPPSPAPVFTPPPPPVVTTPVATPPVMTTPPSTATQIAPDAGSTLVAPRVNAVAPTIAMPAAPPPVTAAAAAVVAMPASGAHAVVAPVPMPISEDAPTTARGRTMFGVPVATPPAPRPEPERVDARAPIVDDDEGAVDRTLMRPGPIPPPRAVPTTTGPMFPPVPEGAQRGGTIETPRFDSPPSWGGVPATMPAQPTPPPVSADLPPALGVPAPVAAAPSAPIPSALPIESGQAAAAHGEIRRGARAALPAAPDWPNSTPTPTPMPPDPAVDKIVVSPEVLSSQTMTAGAARFTPAAQVQRPGGARRVDTRAATVAQAIGMSPPPATPADHRAVEDGVRLDQQVEAARAAGLTGASAPAVVGRYEVLLRIARGGMGTVYLARITGEGGFRRLFALKVIRDHLSQNDEYVRMLLQEARIASRLHHPNVVGIVDIGTLANQHYLVMDYVEGCTFSELLKVHRRTRPPHLIIPILIDALTGLHAAHALVDDDGSALTLVHCDFSPQNMLVGTNGICRITDFGIAKAANALSERSSITRGKPAYVSPEQVLGRRVDHRSDIFSAGVVLWNALTGEQLFGGDTPEQTLQAVLQRPIAPPSTMGMRPPSCFDRICLRALERDPDRRYQTAEQMLIDLRRVAIAEDFLAPSSDVARWVIDTFGRQLELRRQAAGISNRSLGESQPIALPVSVPELGLGEAELTAETKGLPADYGQTPSEDHPSKTTLLRSDVADAPRQRSESRASANAKVFAIGAAVMFATIAIAIAIAKPEWITGGSQDPGGHYAPGAGALRPGEDDGGDTDDDATSKQPSKSEKKPSKTDDAKTDDAKTDDAKVDAKTDVAVEAKVPSEPKISPPPPSDPLPDPDATPKKPKPEKKPKPPKKPKPSEEPSEPSEPASGEGGGGASSDKPKPPPPPAPDPDPKPPEIPGG